MNGLPALNKTIEKIKKQALSGILIGIDGRPLKVRSEHSALNTKLQSSAAIIAKKWLTITYHDCINAGMNWGWWPRKFRIERDGNGDFVIMAFVHDELQNAVAPDRKELFVKIVKQAAIKAGEFYKFRCPVAADTKEGHNWAECH